MRWMNLSRKRAVKKKKLHGLSPRANYTDRATAACRRSDCQLFADRGCHVVSVTDPYGRMLGFLDRSRYFSIKQLLNCTHEAEWTPFQTHYFFSW
jgi:CBS-domain-containing membrane protein